MSASCGVQLGPNANLDGARPFPGSNPWNADVSRLPADPRSKAIIARIGANDYLHPDFGAGRYEGSRIGIPYVVVPEGQSRVTVRFTDWPHESDPGPYPIPPNAPVEGEGGWAGPYDRHVIVVQRDSSRPGCLGRLYELFNARKVGNRWEASNGAIFDLASNALRPVGWTSADAAGLPIFPGLVRYDEVASGEIRHALRVTVPATRRAYVHPARHIASDDPHPHLPPMGTRLRLRADFDVSKFPKRSQVILRALKRYGMIVADHGAPWFISGTPDDRWNNDELLALRRVKGRDFEVVQMGAVITR